MTASAARERGRIPDRVRKLAEIIAATVLCGEISLGSAVVADEWATAHERLGRNRP